MGGCFLSTGCCPRLCSHLLVLPLASWERAELQTRVGRSPLTHHCLVFFLRGCPAPLEGLSHPMLPSGVVVGLESPLEPLSWLSQTLLLAQSWGHIWTLAPWDVL